MINRFRDHGKLELLADSSQDFQTLLAQALKGVRRAARLEGASPKELSSGTADPLGDRPSLIERFDGTRASNDDDSATAYVDSADGDDGILRMKFTAHQLVGM